MCVNRCLYWCCLAVVTGWWFWGCSSSDDDDVAAAANSVTPLSAESFFDREGLTVLDTVTCEGHEGYLLEDLHGKRCLVLAGTPRSMGFQMGALQPEATALMTKGYTFGVVEEMLGITREGLPLLFDVLVDMVMALCLEAVESGAIPPDLVAEMAGVAEGVGAVRPDLEVSFNDVLLLNEGIDACFAILFTGRLPGVGDPLAWLSRRTAREPAAAAAIQPLNGRLVFSRANPHALGCNEFVVSDSATVDGAVYHGRDFMFPIGGGIYPENACMTVYLPESGHPFASVGGPGFVGQMTGINHQGLSMGMDVVRASCTRELPRLGCLLVLRDVIQNCATLDEAVARMRDQDRGVAWLYILGDDDDDSPWTHGLVVEQGMHDPHAPPSSAFTGPDLLPDWQWWLLAGLPVTLGDTTVELGHDYMADLDPELPDAGMMFRTQDYRYPAAFEGVNRMLPPDMRLWPWFPSQGENRDDLVMATNHYIVPRMVCTTLDPWMSLIGDINDSLWRYETLLDLLDETPARIDHDRARELIDFLNPNRPFSARYELDGPVYGHHALMDNRARTIEALFGWYGNWTEDRRTPWVSIDLPAFVTALGEE